MTHEYGFKSPLVISGYKLHKKPLFFMQAVFRIAEIFLSWPIWASSNCFSTTTKRRESMSTLKKVLAEKIAAHRPRVTKLVKEYGDVVPVSYTHLTLPTICSV